MRFLVEETEFALESVWSLSMEWQGLKMRSEVSGRWGLGSELAVLKSGSGDSRWRPIWTRRKDSRKKYSMR